MGDSNPAITRRDLLAGVGVALATVPWRPTAAVAGQATPSLEYALAEPIDAARIARVGIYPALGISRVGNSLDWFLAPEVPGLPPVPDGTYKSGPNDIKKQAQRFRLFAFDAEGEVLGELTAADADIQWTVHVANTKAAWYGFSNPLDNGDKAPGLPGQRRNNAIVGNDARAKRLVINPGARSISGVSANADGEDPSAMFIAPFWETLEVKLGHLQTDESGRLIVVPGDGVSESATPNNPISNFADNDGWQDDWCDGPVRASVTFADGSTFEADPAWVVCCGPDFAPEIPPVVSLWDVMTEVAIDAGWMAPPPRPLSFREHLYPIFRSLALMEWVSTSARLASAWTGNALASAFDDPGAIDKLSDPSADNAQFRADVLAIIRDPNNPEPQQYTIPYMLGDGVNYPDSSLSWLKMPRSQYDLLVSWAAGDFVDDMGDAEAAETVVEFEQIPLAKQPDALTRAALLPCSGGAFHPGVELTWPLRHPGLYAEPYRIGIATNRSPDLIQDLGLLLTPEVALNGLGETPSVVGFQMPGDLTRWMGLPWQCDAFSCQQVTFANDFPVANWWPALIPIDVMPEVYYLALMNPAIPQADREAFLESRVSWSRGVAGVGYHAEASYLDGIRQMIALWSRMGFVVRRPGPEDENRPPNTPSEIYVEVDRGSMTFTQDLEPFR